MKLFLRYDCHGIIFTEESDCALQKRERIGTSFLC